MSDRLADKVTVYLILFGKENLNTKIQLTTLNSNLGNNIFLQADGQTDIFSNKIASLQVTLKISFSLSSLAILCFDNRKSIKPKIHLFQLLTPKNIVSVIFIRRKNLR